MPPYTRLAIAVLVSGLSVEALEQLNPTQLAAAVHISGRVISTSYAPITNQPVTFRKIKGRKFWDSLATTDSTGMFSFDAEGGAQYQVFLPLAEKSLGTVEIVEGGDLTMGDIVLEFPPQGKPVIQSAGPIKIKDLLPVPQPAGEWLQTAKPASVAAVFIPCGAASDEFCANGSVHIVLNDGREVQPPKEKDQVGSSHPSISEDKRVVGWLVDYDNCCTSYPLSLKLIVYRIGKPSCKFEGDGRGIFGWHFVGGGKQVAFYQDFPHGNSVPHYELRDVETCRLLKVQDDDSPKSPAWVNEFGADPEN